MQKQFSKKENYRSWDDIESNFVDLINNHSFTNKPMLDLIRHIKSTGLSERLFAYTSMHSLVISIYPRIERDSEALFVDFDMHSRKWFFHYNPKPFAPKEFEKQYPEELGIGKFDLFIQLMRW